MSDLILIRCADCGEDFLGSEAFAAHRGPWGDCQPRTARLRLAWRDHHVCWALAGDPGE